MEVSPAINRSPARGFTPRQKWTTLISLPNHTEIELSGKFELSKSKNEKFMFNLKAGNGEVILSSQMYEAKPSALQGDRVGAQQRVDR
jgi:uncharacterized protein YegP (UPF0339 family)